MGGCGWFDGFKLLISWSMIYSLTRQSVLKLSFYKMTFEFWCLGAEGLFFQLHVLLPTNNLIIKH